MIARPVMKPRALRQVGKMSRRRRNSHTKATIVTMKWAVP